MAKLTARGAEVVAREMSADGGREYALRSDGRILRRVRIMGKFDPWKIYPARLRGEQTAERFRRALVVSGLIADGGGLLERVGE